MNRRARAREQKEEKGGRANGPEDEQGQQGQQGLVRCGAMVKVEQSEESDQITAAPCSAAVSLSLSLSLCKLHRRPINRRRRKRRATGGPTDGVSCVVLDKSHGFLPSFLMDSVYIPSHSHSHSLFEQDEATYGIKRRRSRGRRCANQRIQRKQKKAKKRRRKRRRCHVT